MVLNVHRNHKLIRDRERGWGSGVEEEEKEEEEEEIIYLSLHCHHQNDSCIEIGSDESHFNVSLIPRDRVTRQCPQTTTFLKKKESPSGFEPRSLCLPA